MRKGCLRSITELRSSWLARLEAVRADAAAQRLVLLLADHPALDVAGAARLLEVSRPSARAALETLTERGVLLIVDGAGAGQRGRPRRWWAAGELLDLLAR